MNGISNLLLILNVRFYIFIIFLQYIKQLFSLLWTLIAGHSCWFYHIFDFTCFLCFIRFQFTQWFSYLIPETCNPKSGQLGMFSLEPVLVSCALCRIYDQIIIDRIQIIYARLITTKQFKKIHFDFITDSFWFLRLGKS